MYNNMEIVSLLPFYPLVSSPYPLTLNGVNEMKTDLPSSFGNRYDILEEIGSGGMPGVYRIFYDHVRSEYLALKKLSRHHTASAAMLHPVYYRNVATIDSEKTEIEK